MFVDANIPAHCGQGKRACSIALISGQPVHAAIDGSEIPYFRYDWPYFGFADHVK
jgi:hypothetical protein